jgi:hypothetical protein
MKRNKLTITSSLAVALAAFAFNAFGGESADSEKPEVPADAPAFEELDTNLDGVITPTEAAESWLAAVFADIDQNQDGVVNRSEYASAIS